MSAMKRTLVIVVPLLLVGLCGFTFFPPGEHAVKLTAYDVLIKRGEKCVLSAKLEHDGPLGINPDMRGYDLTFKGKPFGEKTVKTGKDGIASVEVELDAAAGKSFPVDVVFGGSPRHQAAVATLEVYIWPEKTPILVTDIDHTISDFSQLKVPFAENQNIPILPDADTVLTRLAKDYAVVYLSARDDALYGKTRAWLNLHGFPRGPFFCRDYRIGQSQEEFKKNFLGPFTKRFTNVAVGVGDRESDANAYQAFGIKAYMIDPQGKKTYPAGTVIVKNWLEVEERLKK
jgi:hypothetical protein